MNFWIYFLLFFISRWQGVDSNWWRWTLHRWGRRRTYCDLALGSKESGFTVQWGIPWWKRKFHLFLEQTAQTDPRSGTASLLWSTQERTEVWISTKTKISTLTKTRRTYNHSIISQRDPARGEDYQTIFLIPTSLSSRKVCLSFYYIIFLFNDWPLQIMFDYSAHPPTNKKVIFSTLTQKLFRCTVSTGKFGLLGSLVLLMQILWSFLIYVWET